MLNQNNKFRVAPYINFHTHKTTQNTDVFEVESIHFGETINSDFFTLGRHPWWTQETLTPNEKKRF